MNEIETDYLIIGAGAVGMAFADTLVEETDARIVIVDRRDRPGGHWVDSYPFVTLHQPASSYGVASRELGAGKIDEVGLNKGMADLATGAEIVAYYDAVMRQQFLPTGRVTFLNMSEHDGDGVIRSLTSGETTRVKAKKTVDATWSMTTIPATHPPKYEVADGVTLIPLNELPKVTTPPEGFVVIGGGKTGMDAIIWLLTRGIDPDAIRWIMPRDGWMLNRKNTQNTMAFFNDTMGSTAVMFEAIAQASDIEDMFDRLEAGGYFLRLDPDVRPAMFHAPTVSEAEMAEIRRVKNVVRMGRIERIEQDQIVLQEGEIPTSPGVVHVDCSASAISNFETKPIFDGDLITPQMVRAYQPVFSASFVAHIEATREGDAEKNRLCGVVPLPNADTDFVFFTAAAMMNQYNWGQEKDLREWLRGNRLDGFSKLIAGIDKDDEEKGAVMQRIRDASMPAMMKLQKFMAELDAA